MNNMRRNLLKLTDERLKSERTETKRDLTDAELLELRSLLSTKELNKMLSTDSLKRLNLL